MSEQNKKLSEKFAEMLATFYLDEEFGEKIFIGPMIENILSKEAVLIYQDIPDDAYYGALIKYKNLSFITINTNHNLRIRYYSAAHELWHFIWGNSEMDSTKNDLDHERAAGHFAAVLMLPQSLISDLWIRMADKYSEEERVIYIADLSSMPYEAVTRRLKEVGLSISSKIEKREEQEWVAIREEFNLGNSALDSPYKFVSFAHFEKVVKDSASRGRISLDDAANLIYQFSPELAEEYIKRKTLMAKELENSADE